MIALQVVCLTVIAVAGLAVYLSPPFLPFGVGIIAVAAVILLQSILLRFMGSFVRRDSVDHLDDVPKSDVSELESLKMAYQKFRLLLARAAGFVGFIYGIATGNVYYIVLGAAVVILFWILDRLGQAREGPSSVSFDQENQPDQFKVE